MIDWNAKKLEILARVDLKSELEGFGVRFADTAPSAKGWWPVHNPYNTDRDPSAGVNIGSGGERGYLCTFNQGAGVRTAISFWDLARDFHPSLSGSEFKEIVSHYAEQTGVDLPKKSKIVATYDYTDPDGKLIFQVVRMYPKSFRQRRPDPEKSDEWIWNLNGTETVLYRLPEIITADQVIIAEGEKDADRVFDAGFTATTCPMGAGKWRKSYNQYLKGKDVIILQDNDPAGQGHAAQVSHELWGVAKSIKIIEFPHMPLKADVSDWLDAGHSTEELKTLIDSTEPLKEKPPAPAAENKIKTMGTGPGRFFTESGRYRPALVVDEILKTNDLFFDGQSFFRYGIHGYWKKINDEVIGKTIKTMLRDRAESRFIYDAIGLLKYECFKPQEEREKSSMFLNLQNGMFDLKTKKLIPHDKKYFSTIQLPVTYNPQAECPRFKRFLSEIFSDAPEKAKTIQEYVGYCLYPENIFEKALFCIGHGSNGKTTFINAIEKLFGTQNVSHLELYQLSERFSLINLKDSILNTCADLSTNKKTDLNQFKQITSRDTIQSDVKFGKRFITFKPRCKCIFAMNSTPAINDRSHGLSRRLIIINFNQRFSEDNRDVNLDHELKKEMSGILNWALDGLDELLSNKTFYECAQVKAEKDSFLSEIDNVKMFVQELCRVEYSATIRKTTLLEGYLRFCESCKLYPLKRPDFYRQLYVLIPDMDEYKEKSGPWCFQGIDLISEDIDN